MNLHGIDSVAWMQQLAGRIEQRYGHAESEALQHRQEQTPG